MTPDLGLERPHRLLPEGWPLLAILLGYPLWWLLGLSNFMWVLMAVPMLLALLMERGTRMPRGSAILLIYLVLTAVSVIQLDGGTQYVTWAYRWSVQASAVIAFVYAYTRDPGRFPTRLLVNALAVFWLYIVAGGVLALLAPSVEIPSLLEAVLPNSLLNDSYVRGLVVPQTAQVHEFLGFPVSRPAAPFTFTNQWGSSLALSTPFFLLWARNGGVRRRLFALVMAGVAIVPIVQSLNRGLWLSLAVAAAYVGFRYATRGNVRALAAVGAGVVLIVVVLLLTPLGDLVLLRVETGHSDNNRLSLYSQSLEYAQERPLTGYGRPVFDETLGPYSAPVGTHGHVWFVLVSYGIPATITMLASIGWVLWRTRRAPSGSSTFWIHVVFVMVALQTFTYALLPSQWPWLFAAAGIAMRDVDRGGGMLVGARPVSRAGTGDQTPAPQRVDTSAVSAR